MLGKNGRCAITVNCGRRNLILCHLDDLAGIGCGVVGIATSRWTILYNITVLLCSLLSWRVFHNRSASIDVILLVLS